MSLSSFNGAKKPAKKPSLNAMNSAPKAAAPAQAPSSDAEDTPASGMPSPTSDDPLDVLGGRGEPPELGHSYLLFLDWACQGGLPFGDDEVVAVRAWMGEFEHLRPLLWKKDEDRLRTEEAKMEKAAAVEAAAKEHGVSEFDPFGF